MQKCELGLCRAVGLNDDIPISDTVCPLCEDCIKQVNQQMNMKIASLTDDEIIRLLVASGFPTSIPENTVSYSYDAMSTPS